MKLLAKFQSFISTFKTATLAIILAVVGSNSTEALRISVRNAAPPRLLRSKSIHHERTGSTDLARPSMVRPVTFIDTPKTKPVNSESQRFSLDFTKAEMRVFAKLNEHGIRRNDGRPSFRSFSRSFSSN